MRASSPFYLRSYHPALKAARTALAAGAVAGLAVLGACADGAAPSKITGGMEPTLRHVDVPLGGNHHVVVLCAFGPTPPGGTYHFVIGRREAPPMYAHELPTSPLDGSDGGGGPYNPGDLIPVAGSGAGPGFVDLAPGQCVDVFVRDDDTNGDDTVDPGENSNNRMYGLFNPPGTVDIDVTIPAGYTLSLSCTNDANPVTNPQQCATDPTYSSANVFHGSSVTYTFTGPASICPDGSITAGFNGTAIPALSTIWFTANLKPNGPIVDGTTISFQNSSIDMNGTIIPGPSGTVTYSAGALTATTAFVAGAWQTIVPLSYTKDVFLTGTQYTTLLGLPGGVKPVTWTGAFSSNTAGVTAKWQFAAAVYNGFGAYPALGVKPIGDKTLLYPNSDKQGTPENFKANHTSGAMGGGGSNYTGSWSATKAPCVEVP